MKGGAEISFADGTTKNRHRLRGQNGDGFLLTQIMSTKDGPNRALSFPHKRLQPLAFLAAEPHRYGGRPFGICASIGAE